MFRHRNVDWHRIPISFVFLPSYKDGRYISTCVRLDWTALGAVLRILRLHLDRVSQHRDVSSTATKWGIVSCRLHVCLPCSMGVTNYQHMLRPLPPYLTLSSKELTKQPWLLFWERTACKVGPWGGFGQPGFGEGSHHSLADKSGSPCLYKPCGLCSMPAFLLGVWNFAMCWAEGTYMTIPWW